MCRPSILRRRFACCTVCSRSSKAHFKLSLYAAAVSKISKIRKTSKKITQKIAQVCQSAACFPGFGVRAGRGRRCSEGGVEGRKVADLDKGGCRLMGRGGAGVGV